MKRTLLLSLILIINSAFAPEAVNFSAKKLLTFPNYTTSLEIGQNLVVTTLPKVEVKDETPQFQFNKYIHQLYTQIGLDRSGLSTKAFERAMIGYYNLQGKLKKKDIISIVDFDQKSTKKRLYVIDIKQKSLLFHSLVAHGKNTGWDMATNFGNKHRSLKSSLGFLVTAETYFGKFGLALRLDGQEYSINNNARSRGIVMHGATYVNQDIIKQQNRLGRSYGCPALPYGIHKKVINQIKGGSLFYIHKSGTSYERKSKLLNKTTAVAAAQILHDATLIASLK